MLFGTMVAPLRPAAGPRSEVRADRIVVLKSARQLQLWSHGRMVKSYRVALGLHPVGHKEREGDGRTPEGVYTVVRHNPKSQFHLSLRLSYPNDADRSRAMQFGVSPGGDIRIHGLPNGYGWVGAAHTTRDWTAGCIAVTNTQIEEIYRAVPDGTPIEIRP